MDSSERLDQWPKGNNEPTRGEAARLVDNLSVSSGTEVRTLTRLLRNVAVKLETTMNQFGLNDPGPHAKPAQVDSLNQRTPDF